MSVLVVLGAGGRCSAGRRLPLAFALDGQAFAPGWQAQAACGHLAAQPSADLCCGHVPRFGRAAFAAAQAVERAVWEELGAAHRRQGKGPHDKVGALDLQRGVDTIGAWAVVLYLVRSADERT